MVEAMVWDGLDRAAAKVGITQDYAYRLLRHPAVMAKYRSEVDALRCSGKARLIHRLEAIAEQRDNLTATVAAAKVLLGLGPNASRSMVPPGTAELMAGWVVDCSEALARGAAVPFRGLTRRNIS
ncbi:hypothetical protein [Siculibacillus lacustris]|nr:hypothetical protein [Siculibacillus lacustris]